jgi:RHO1 GDP-GTP exchange protein 1/2
VTIEWEGTAERVAFHPPHILLFDSRFIEVRNVETGRLAQIIPGKEIRCIWDGRGLPSNQSNQVLSESEQQEAKVHAVMTNMITLDGQARTKAIAQQVFELVPTVPLYNPPPVNRRSMAQTQQQQQQLQQQQYAYQQMQQQQPVDLQPQGMNPHQQELYYAQQRQQLQRMHSGYTNSDATSLHSTAQTTAGMSAMPGQTGYYAQQHQAQHYPQHQQQQYHQQQPQQHQYQQQYGYTNSGGYTPSLTGPRSLEGHGVAPGPSDLGRNGSWRS